MMDQPPEYTSVVERNFTSHSVPANPGIAYLRHPTGVLIMSLAPNHELMQKQVATITWNIPNKKGRDTDRSKVEVSGKGKKGGLLLSADTRICIVRDSEGREYTIRSGIKANLLEVNERLAEEPDLMRTAASAHGFIAILMPPLSGRNVEMAKEFAKDEA